MHQVDHNVLAVVATYCMVGIFAGAIFVKQAKIRVSEIFAVLILLLVNLGPTG